jgi:predicted HicB family RNase H-like nuclease
MKQNRKERGAIEKLLHVRVDPQTHGDIWLIAQSKDMSLNLFYRKIFEEFVKNNAVQIQKIKQQPGDKKWS